MRTTYACEPQIGAAPRTGSPGKPQVSLGYSSARRCTEKYIEDAPQAISRTRVPVKTTFFTGWGLGPQAFGKVQLCWSLGKAVRRS